MARGRALHHSQGNGQWDDDDHLKDAKPGGVNKSFEKGSFVVRDEKITLQTIRSDNNVTGREILHTNGQAKFVLSTNGDQHSRGGVGK